MKISMLQVLKKGDKVKILDPEREAELQEVYLDRVKVKLVDNDLLVPVDKVVLGKSLQDEMAHYWDQMDKRQREKALHQTLVKDEDISKYEGASLTGLPNLIVNKIMTWIRSELLINRTPPVST